MSAAEFLKPEEVAELMQVSTKSVYRWANTDPTMPCFRRGSVMRFPRDALMAWITKQMPRASRRGPQEPAQAHGTAA
jgi:excisionase family DNA binding protein